MPYRTRIMLTISAVVLAGCVSTQPAQPPSSGESPSSVVIVSFEYAPSDLDIGVGTTVTWTNEDEFAHTVTGGTPDDPTGPEGVMGDLGDLNGRGETFTWTFEEPGTYEYFCRFHPGRMRGTVTVEP